MTLIVYTIIIPSVGSEADTGKAPPKRGLTGRKKMKPTLQILILVAVLMLASSNAY
nr:MAG TPA: hypothetical protein [Caudoviricetes sp.]